MVISGSSLHYFNAKFSTHVAYQDLEVLNQDFGLLSEPVGFFRKGLKNC